MPEGKTSRTGSLATDASLDLLAQTDTALQSEIAAIKRQLNQLGQGQLTEATPGSPFVLSETPHKSGEGMTEELAINVPRDAERLRMTWRYTDQSASKNQEETWEDLDPNQVASGQVTVTPKERFDFNREWGVARLTVWRDGGGRTHNPNPRDDVGFLVVHTTGQPFNLPSAPHVGNIIENQLDLITKAFDAFIVVQVIAPASASTPYAGTVTTNGTTAVVGTQSFAGVAAIGQAIQINSETHIITNLSGVNLTVDFPYKQSNGSGKSATILTLQTWAAANAKRVVAKFQLNDDANNRVKTKSHRLTSDETAQTSITFRIDGFTAARKYRWTRNVVISVTGDRESTPGSNQVFIAGGFTDATSGIPELTSPGYVYDSTDPYNDKLRNVIAVVTQPNPPVALDRADFRRFTKGPGTVAITTGVAQLVGSGTAFLTDLADTYHVIVGSQTFIIFGAPSDNTHAATGAVSTVTATLQDYYISKKVLQDKNLRRAKYHPNTGGQIEIAWGDKKTKKLLAHIFRSTIFAQNGEQKSIDDNFTTGDVAEVPEDPGIPVFSDIPRMKFNRGKIVAKIDSSAVANTQTLKGRIEVAVHNGVDSFNIDDPTSESKVSGIVFYWVGANHKTLAADLDRLIRIFGKAAVLNCRFRYTNDKGAATSSDSTNTTPLSGFSDVTTKVNLQNVIKNGHFTYNNGTKAKHFQDYNPVDGTFGDVDQTGRLRLNLNNHFAFWRNTSGETQRFLVEKIGKRFLKNEYWSTAWNIFSNGTPTIDEFVVMLATIRDSANPLSTTISGTAGQATVNTTAGGFATDNLKVGSVVGNGTEWRTVVGPITSDNVRNIDRAWTNTFGPVTGFAVIPQATRLSQTNLALSTADKRQWGKMLTDSDLDTSLPIYWVVVLRDTVDTVTFPQIDEIVLNRGEAATMFQFSNADSFETNFAGTSEDFDSQPTGGSSGGSEPSPGTGGAGQILS